MIEFAIILTALPTGIIVGVVVESARRARAARARYNARVRYNR